MSADIDRDDTYVKQLYEMFNSCDISGTGLLGNDELFELCMRLQLDDTQTNYIITNLIGNDLIAKINFDDFKEIFVSLLTQSQHNDCNEIHQYLFKPYEKDKLTSQSLSTQSNNDYNINEIHNTEEYLRSIWNRLGVGSHGYLNVDELFTVCEHIGMSGISNEMINQLFEKLDYDQDGKVSFDEFLQGVLQHHNQSTDSNTNLIQLRESPINKHNTDTSTTTTHNHQLNCFVQNNDRDSVLTEHNNPFYSNICSHLMLFDIDRNGINYEQIKEERDRLRINILEANARADLLAQEVDDHYAKLEASSQSKLIVLKKKYHERIRSLEDELQREKDSLASKYYLLKQDITKKLAVAQEQEIKLKDTLNLLDKENKRLKNEVQNLTRRLYEMQNAYMDLYKQVEDSNVLKKKISRPRTGVSVTNSTHQSI